MANLNPQIVEIDIGIRELRKITLYPLSMADQFKMTDTVVQAIQQFASVGSEELSDEAIVEKMVSLIEENIDRILKLIIDPEESVGMTDLTNDQFTDICEIVYTVNYEGSIKKLKSLAGKVKGALSGMSRQPVPESGSK